jgi:two-component system sensor histidine kinase KdpD
LAPLVAEAFRAEAPEVEVRLEIDDAMPPVDMHLVTVQQVLTNLLNNARKYGGTDIGIRVGWRERSVCAAVLDRGPGVADDELARLFTPYFRSSRTAASATGLGLGLAVCQRLVEASGGTMYAERRAGGGMEIGFCVPPSAG